MGLQEENAAASPDVALVRRVQAGDANAYNLLVIRYQHKVHQVIGKFVGNSADVGDIAQEAFLKAYRAIGGFRGESSFYTWLYRIVVNVAKSYLESRRTDRQMVDVDGEGFDPEGHGLLVNRDTPDRIIESEELQKVIAAAVEQMPEELRQAIMLREVEEMSYDDIAAVMKVPVGTVRSRIFRARQFIEAKLSRHASAR